MEGLNNLIKKILIFGILGGTLYFFLSFHIILVNNTIKLLRKSSLTLNYTFYNAKGKTNAIILSVDDLREDGIGDLLVEMGKMSSGQYSQLMRKYEYDEEED
jgi:hypothetical protein